MVNSTNELKEFKLGDLVIMVDQRTHEVLELLAEMQQRVLRSDWAGLVISLVGNDGMWMTQHRANGEYGIDMLAFVADDATKRFRKISANWNGEGLPDGSVMSPPANRSVQAH